MWNTVVGSSRVMPEDGVTSPLLEAEQFAFDGA
jgi:hypothetical protein